jgi:hypothetical protein
MSSDWKNEDDIKAELRVLTDQLRKVRHELRNMVAPPKALNPSRAFLHRQAWPATPPARAEAADTDTKKKASGRSKKKR